MRVDGSEDDFSSSEDEQASDVQVEAEEEDGEMIKSDPEFEEVISNTSSNTTAEVITEEDAIAKEIAVKEQILKATVDELSEKLRLARIKESKIRDKISESGKMGFYMVQAQVTDFQRKQELRQKELVTENRGDFVTRIFPLIDTLRTIPSQAPAETEREQMIHKNFGSLLSSMLLILEKAGYKEFHADIGTKLDPALHKVAGVVPGEIAGVIAEVVRPGLIFKDNQIIRPALVISTEVKSSSNESLPKSEDVKTE